MGLLILALLIIKGFGIISTLFICFCVHSINTKLKEHTRNDKNISNYEDMFYNFSFRLHPIQIREREIHEGSTIS